PEVLLRHQSAMPLLIIKTAGIAHIGQEIGLGAMLGNLCQVRRVVGAFTKQGMAVDAVVLVPYVLAVSDLRGDVFGVGQLGKLAMAVQRQSEKHDNGYGCRGPCKNSGLPVSHGDASSQTLMPVQCRTVTMNA